MPDYTQAEHDAAIQQLRTEFAAAIKERDDELATLRPLAGIQEQLDEANATIQQLQAISTKYDALRNGVAAFASGQPDGEQQLLKTLISQTEGGPEKLLAIERMILNSNLATIQARLNQIG